MSDYPGVYDEEEVADGGDGQDQIPAPTPVPAAGSRPAAITQALALESRTGSQGAAAPSYSADVAQSRSRVAKILADSLRGLEGTSGLERVGNAAMQVLAGQGKINFPQAMAAMQQQDVGRAVNIANALSGLSKAEGAGAMTLKDQLNLVQRQTEAAARSGNQEATLLQRSVSALAGKYADPAAATNAAYEYAVNWKQENPNATINDFAKMSAGMAQYVAGKGLRLAKQPGGGEGEGSDIGGPSRNPDGTIRHSPYKKEKGVPMPGWQVQYNSALKIGDTDTANTIIATNVRAASPIRAEDRKPFQDFITSHNAAVSTSGLIGKVLDIADKNPASLAQVGQVQGFISSVGNQVGSLLQSLSNSDSENSETRAQARSTLNALTNAEERDRVYGSALNGIIRQWNLNAQDSAQLRSYFTSLAYAMAQTNEPSGRFSNADVQAAMTQIAGTNGDPEALRKVLTNKLATLSSNMETRRKSTPFFGQVQTPWSPSFDVGGISMAVRSEPKLSDFGYKPPASAPAPAPTPTPAPTPDPLEGRTASDRQGNRVIRRNGQWVPVQ
jgi:hypothetical protein